MSSLATNAYSNPSPIQALEERVRDLEKRLAEV